MPNINRLYNLVITELVEAYQNTHRIITESSDPQHVKEVIRQNYMPVSEGLDPGSSLSHFICAIRDFQILIIEERIAEVSEKRMSVDDSQSEVAKLQKAFGKLLHSLPQDLINPNSENILKEFAEIIKTYAAHRPVSTASTVGRKVAIGVTSVVASTVSVGLSAVARSGGGSFISTAPFFKSPPEKVLLGSQAIIDNFNYLVKSATKDQPQSSSSASGSRFAH